MPSRNGSEAVPTAAPFASGNVEVPCQSLDQNENLRLVQLGLFGLAIWASRGVCQCAVRLVVVWTCAMDERQRRASSEAILPVTRGGLPGTGSGIRELCMS